MSFTYSIIIPHYNSSQLLQRMLSSIPNRDDIQIIVVDDHSMEEEQSNLRKLKHNNLEIYYEGNNYGAGHARNVGLSRVKGKWVLVVDADDCFALNSFDVLDRYVNSNVDYVGFCAKSVENTLEPNDLTIFSDKSTRKYLHCKNKSNLNLFKYHNIVCWNKLVSTDFIKRNNIKFEECQVNNDVLYAILVGYYAQSFLVIEDELYYYINNPKSITHKKRSIEYEFLFYLQAQKRNGFFKAIGLNYWPYYRYDILYIPHIIRKHGMRDALKFFKLWWMKKSERDSSKMAYLKFLRK